MDMRGKIVTKIFYALAWAFVASYYFVWGSNEPSVAVASIDESGWSTDGTFVNEIIHQRTTTE